MIWLFKKLFGIAVTIAIIFFALHLQIGGRQAKDYIVEAWKNPIVQAVVQQGKETVMGYLNKDISPSVTSPTGAKDDSAPPMEQLEDDERKELENVLQDKAKSKTH